MTPRISYQSLNFAKIIGGGGAHAGLVRRTSLSAALCT